MSLVHRQKEMTIPNEIIIIGGGASIQEGLKFGLKDRIKDKFIITLNYAYKYFDHTYMCFVDKELYAPSAGSLNSGQYADYKKELKQLPLILGMYSRQVDEIKFDNTILLKNSGEFHKEKSLEKGFYKGTLCGLYALSIASYLLKFKGIIYLLGFDWTRNKKNTHFYKDIKHRGMGYTSFYERHKPELYFKPFLKEKNLKIYNVSPDSNIDCFEKISYIKMFLQLSKETYNQEELRNNIRRKLCTK